MASKLVIYDVSPFVYSVAGIKKYTDMYKHGFPIGGMSYFLKYLCLDLGTYNDVVLCFDSKSFRKQIYPKYKAGREANYSVFAQLDMLYDVLSSLGITCLKCNGYEADDLIYSVMELNRGKYNQIEIRGSDYDLAHNIIRSNEKLMPANSNINSITERTFKNSFYKDQVILYNTISAYKVFTGDKSDNIPPFISSKGITGKRLYNSFCSAILSNKNGFEPKVLRSRQFLEIFLKKLSGTLTEVDYESLKLNMDLVFPRYCEEIDCSEVCGIRTIDKKGLISFLSFLGDFRSLNNIDSSPLPYSEGLVEKFKLSAKELKTGEYAADRGKRYTPISVNSSITNLREFT